MTTVRRTTGDYIDLIEHALGKTPDSRHLLIDDFNDAGRALVNDHAWSWRTRNNVTIEIPADSTFAILPEDFGEIVDIRISGSLTTVTQTSVSEINRMRAFGQFDAYSLFIAFDDGFDSTNGSDGTQQTHAIIYPSQSTARSDLTISYRAKWVDMESNDLERVPFIPRDWERALLLFARSFAISLENQNDPYENQALFGPMGEIERLKTLDATRQTNYGQPTHNVLSRGRGVYRPFRSIGQS